MEFKKVGGHTFAPELLTDGVIIDVGCRGFVFSSAFPGKKVYCIDMDDKVWEGLPKDNDFHNIHCAISEKEEPQFYYENGEGTVLKDLDPDQSHPFKACWSMTMSKLYTITGTNVDVLKLDCEGAEYMILGETFKPIPKQITVEFHYHTIPDIHNKHIDSIFERLSKDYNIYNKVWAEDNGSGNNFWDILFIRKDVDTNN